MNHPVMTHARPWWLLLVLLVSSLLGACGGSGGPAPAPTIIAQPVDTSVVVGTAATLSVGATGAGIAYEWQSSSDGIVWASIPGATASSYTTPVTSAADNGRRFRVVVSAAGISVASSAVTLTVTGLVVAPAITVQPAAQSVNAPDPASFSITASGTAPNYQWQRSTDGGATWADIAGATAATYNTGATITAMNDQRYRVVVGNASGSVTSFAAVLTVNPTPTLPVFTAQPANQSVSAGSAAAFTVTAIGTPAPTLQWQRSTDGGVSWTPIAAAIDATYNTGPVTPAQNGERYRAVASNSVGSAPSDAATLTVAASVAPSITSQPASVTILAGQGAGFAVGASGTPTPTLQWQLSTDNGASWSNINGATSDVLSLPAGVPLDYSGRQFRAVASNASGSVTSQAAVLTVNPSFVPTFQFNLFGFNAGPAVFLLYGGSVKDSAGTIQCSGYTSLSDPCPKWRGNYPSGTALSLTATPWPGWRVSGWVGGDCGSPGNAATVTLIIDHNSDCRPQFELIPGAAFTVSAVPAGAWVGLVVEMVADRFGNLVVPDSPRISCGPLASAQICDVSIDVGASPFLVLRLRALPLATAPVGQLRWTCTSNSPHDNTPVVRTVSGSDIDIGPIYGNTACSAELIPTP
jgi:hypothetical protein